MKTGCRFRIEGDRSGTRAGTPCPAGFSNRISKACAAGLLLVALSASAGEPRRIVCSTFPVYQLTRAVTEGSGLEVDLLLPAGLGCPHDHALAPQDLRRLEAADVLVVNGLGLDDFLAEALQRAGVRPRVVDSSARSRPLPAEDSTPAHAQEEHAHEHGASNPHLFASPRRAAEMVAAIAQGLAEADGRKDMDELYARNAGTYAARLNRLADEFSDLGRRLRNRRVVTQHGVFAYLAHDTGLEVIAVVETHPGQAPSAAEMLRLAAAIRERKAGAVFTEPQYSAAVGETLARETGIPTAQLDPAASGPEDAPPDYYERVMRSNLETLRRTLGTRE
jgi:ABC-type Zn uptake system ZnuABC Zn-binding protein ZnuA